MASGCLKSFANAAACGSKACNPPISVCNNNPSFRFIFNPAWKDLKLHKSLLIHPPFLFRPWYAVSGVTFLQFALYLYITQSYHHGECSISLALSFALQLETTVSYPFPSSPCIYHYTTRARRKLAKCMCCRCLLQCLRAGWHQLPCSAAALFLVKEEYKKLRARPQPRSPPPFFFTNVLSCFLLSRTTKCRP